MTPRNFHPVWLLLTPALLGQAVEFVPVVARQPARVLELPAEIQPFLSVSLHAKVAGYVDRILVDRGDRAKEGQAIAELSAPEMAVKIAEAESKVQAAESDRLQVEAQIAALDATHDRLKKAMETPGAIAGNEVVQIEKQIEAARALLRSRQQAVKAAEAAVAVERELQSYLHIKAPFDGVVTERLLHPGALVGPNSEPLLTIQQIERVRVVVSVPEEDIAGIVVGAKVALQAPAFPGRSFNGTVARVSHSLDRTTRTMPVELDCANEDLALSPGMYASVKWPVRRGGAALYVPKSSVVTTAERTFVIREKNGHAEWVDVRVGPAEGDLTEVQGAVHAGDRIVRRGNDEIRDGSALGERR